MEFAIAGVFNRSVTAELDNGERFETAKEITIFLNGQQRMTTRRNVFTLTGLLPDTTYELSVSDGQETTAHSFRTKRESVLLNVRRFGAVGDGKRDDTAAIQAAILSCPKDGTVYIPKGTYFVTPLFLKSDMTLYLGEGATLLADPDRRHYPILPGMTRASNEKDEEEYNLASWEGNPLDAFASLITGIHVSNVDITGPGVLDGNADHSDWWQEPRIRRGAWRPNILFFNHCTNIRVQNLSIQNSPGWAVHPYYSDHLQFLNLTITNPYNSPNTDGFDPESCTDVTLLGSVISVGDDCIAIKSGKIYMAVNHFKRTDKVAIRNCLLERGHGSVTIGSEIAGGVTNVRVSQCIFRETDRGLRVKTRRGRGEKSLLDDIVFENITMDRVHMPVTLNMFYFCDPDGHSDYVQDQAPAPVDDKTPEIGRITLRNAECSGISASFLCAVGLPERPIRGITIENVSVSFLPEGEREPEHPVMMDNFPALSGVGIYAQNVETLTLRNVSMEGDTKGEPCLYNVAQFCTM